MLYIYIDCNEKFANINNIYIIINIIYIACTQCNKDKLLVLPFHILFDEKLMTFSAKHTHIKYTCTNTHHIHMHVHTSIHTHVHTSYTHVHTHKTFTVEGHYKVADKVLSKFTQ